MVNTPYTVRLRRGLVKAYLDDRFFYDLAGISEEEGEENSLPHTQALNTQRSSSSLSSLFETTETAWRAATDPSRRRKLQVYEDDTAKLYRAASSRRVSLLDIQEKARELCREEMAKTDFDTLEHIRLPSKDDVSEGYWDWEDAVIHLDEAAPVNPDHVSLVSIFSLEMDDCQLRKALNGTLPDREKRIRIGRAVRRLGCVSRELAGRDLNEYYQMLWDVLFTKSMKREKNDTVAALDQAHHASKLAAIDEYIVLLNDIYNHNIDPSFLDPTSHTEDLDAHLGAKMQVRWLEFYKQARIKYSQQLGHLRAIIHEAELEEDIDTLRQARREKRRINNSMFHEYIEQLEDEIWQILKLPVEPAIKELEMSYSVFKAQKLTAAMRAHSTLELVEQLDESQAHLSNEIDDQLATVDINLEACERLLAGSESNIRKGTTRLHRLLATDVHSPERRKEEMEKRLGHRDAASIIETACINIADAQNYISTLQLCLDKVKIDLKEVDGPIVDAHLAAETALLAFMADREKEGKVEAMISQKS